MITTESYYLSGQSYERILSQFYIRAILKKRRKGRYDHETIYENGSNGGPKTHKVKHTVLLQS